MTTYMQSKDIPEQPIAVQSSPEQSTKHGPPTPSKKRRVAIQRRRPTGRVATLPLEKRLKLALELSRPNWEEGGKLAAIIVPEMLSKACQEAHRAIQQAH
ncbi:MAG: hypothetical protein C5B50_19765 [Verrucomicrobia bacterium]|nr:MAG: hypothetical protein C5B50_19765 [Verrucomicrobiota bacterium]